MFVKHHHHRPDPAISYEKRPSWQMLRVASHVQCIDMFRSIWRLLHRTTILTLDCWRWMECGKRGNGAHLITHTQTHSDEWRRYKSKGNGIVVAFKSEPAKYTDSMSIGRVCRKRAHKLQNLMDIWQQTILINVVYKYFILFCDSDYKAHNKHKRISSHTHLHTHRVLVCLANK